jgi:hypothetical protein
MFRLFYVVPYLIFEAFQTTEVNPNNLLKSSIKTKHGTNSALYKNLDDLFSVHCIGIKLQYDLSISERAEGLF